ncbi:hypothetical protein COW20_18485, partial [bacterium (Candidatus Blackallbacteria) CG13_big_fil_rev_8_21_14_2_50_49_14]
FQVLSAPQPINCPSDYQYYGYACAQTGLVTALNASLGFFPVPPPTPAGDSVSLTSSGLYSRIVEGQSGYYYGVNVLETGLNAQNQPIATRLILSTGVNAWDLGSLNGGFSRNVSSSIELVSSDGLNFTLDTSRSWPAGFGFNYQSDTNKLTDGGEVCVEGSWGTSNNSMWVNSASGVWNPTESKAQFQLSISGTAQGGASVFAVNSEGTSFCSNYGVGGPSTASISLEVYLPPQPDPQPTPTPTPSESNPPDSAAEISLEECSKINAYCPVVPRSGDFQILAKKRTPLEYLIALQKELSSELAKTTALIWYQNEINRLQTQNTILREELRQSIQAYRNSSSNSKKLVDATIDKMQMLMNTRKIMERYYAAIIYLNNASAMFPCESCVKKALQIVGKQDKGDLFEREILEIYRNTVASNPLSMKTNLTYQLPGRSDTYELDFESSDRVGEISNQLRRFKGGKDDQIERHLEYAHTQGGGKPVELVYGYNTKEQELNKIRTDFASQIRAGNLILTDWRDVVLPPL